MRGSRPWTVPFSYSRGYCAARHSGNATSGAGKERCRIVTRFVRRKTQAGQGLAEYALILGLVAVLAIAALTFLGSTISAMMSTLGNAL